MPSRARSLIVQAREAATWRGHHMGRFKTVELTHRRTYKRSACAVCGMEVDIDTYPPPNGIDIAGPAVALNCRQ